MLNDARNITVGQKTAPVNVEDRVLVLESCIFLRSIPAL
jgi:hypothetical protein